MVKQGDIIKVDLNPTLGHEQSGYRPCVVLSNKTFNKFTNLLLVVPITNTQSTFPLHIPLDARTTTTGSILCQHIKSIDKTARSITVVESLPRDILEHVINMVYGEIEL